MTTVLRLPLAVSFAWRFLTSFSACCWVTNNPNRSSPAPTDQPYSVCSTRKVIVGACLTIDEHSTIGADQRIAGRNLRCRRAFATVFRDITADQSGSCTPLRRLRIRRHVAITLLLCRDLPSGRKNGLPEGLGARRKPRTTSSGV